MTYTLELTMEELRIIAAGLNELPHKISRPLIDKLSRQIDEESKADPAPAIPTPEQFRAAMRKRNEID